MTPEWIIGRINWNGRDQAAKLIAAESESEMATLRKVFVDAIMKHDPFFACAEDHDCAAAIMHEVGESMNNREEK